MSLYRYVVFSPSSSTLRGAISKGTTASNALIPSDTSDPLGTVSLKSEAAGIMHLYTVLTELSVKDLCIGQNPFATLSMEGTSVTSAMSFKFATKLIPVSSTEIGSYETFPLFRTSSAV